MSRYPQHCFDGGRAAQPDRAKKEGLRIPRSFASEIDDSHLVVVGSEHEDSRTTFHIVYVVGGKPTSLVLDEQALRYIVDMRFHPLSFTSTQLYLLSQLRRSGTEKAWAAVKADNTFREIRGHSGEGPWRSFVAACYPACDDPHMIHYESDLYDSD